VRALLGETFRLLAAHLNLFTLISLTVWLPGHVLRNYFEFFEPEDGAGQSMLATLAIVMVFEPLVVAGTLVALGRIKSGLPVGYAVAMTQGLAAWGRLLGVRSVVIFAVALPALGARFAAPARGFPAVAMGTLLIGLAVVTAILLVRFAVADSVVVLEGANAVTVWRRAAALTAGRRWPMFGTLFLLFAAVVSFAMFTEQLVRAVPELNHFVVRVLLDCLVAVSQSLFTIALFLFYWRGRGSGGPPPAVGAGAPS
jgi:hypothetical protein